MSISIAEYYIDELNNWKSAADLHIAEIADSEEWLRILLHFDSIPAFAQNVEHYLNLLLLSKQNLHLIKFAIQTEDGKLYREQVPLPNDLITEELRTQHKQLRNKMHQTEKEYLDFKYECDEFLADAMDVQNRIAGKKN